MYKNYENNLFRIIPHYSALFRIILVVLTVINAESSNGQTSPDNSSDSDALTISLYSGIGNGVDFGFFPTGIGTEWMYKDVSANLGFGIDGNGMGCSIGTKIYNSDANSKIKFFGGINYITYNPYPLNNQFTYDAAITAGYKHTSSNGIYMTQEVGASPLTGYSYLGMNVGYQFKPIHLK